MIPKETVDLILDTARIEEVVGDFVTLKRRGANYVACCPFHNEKTPSFNVNPARGIYKCFGCGKAGSAVGFVMEYEHMTYPEALRYLAQKYHIEVKEEEETAEQIAARQRSESLMAVSEYARKFFLEQLQTPEGHAVGLGYYRKRGIEDATIEQWSLGWAPSGKTTLVDAARAAGYKEEYLVAAGLAIQQEDGSLIDKFRERIMFPIHSVSGRVIAFSGRTLKSDNPAKYVNSPETEIYIKSKNLLGIYFAKSSIAKEDRCILVEGNVDVVMMHQMGITNVVASCGTSLTEEQIRLIKRFTENITIMYDGDSAGLHAAIRAIGLILKEGMNPRVVFLPDGDDPDSFSRKHTLEEIREYIATHEQDGIAFKTDLMLKDAGNDPLKKANLINEIADTVALIPDAIKRQVYVDTVAKRFEIEADIIQDRVRKTRENNRHTARREDVSTTNNNADGRNAEEGTFPSAKNYADATGKESSPAYGSASNKGRLLEPSEKELLGFILRFGRTPLQFESDSEFYDPEGAQTVAEFIDAALAGDDIRFANNAYQAAYDAYFTLYDQGLEQDAIVLALLNGEDRAVATVTADLSTEKYELTVHNFTDALTTTDSWLVNFVPRAILAYHDKRLQARQEELKAKLSSATPEEQLEILTNLGRINEIKKTINIKLGRLKK
ncbi:MAG: DNA primase [Bacteroidales bacterium]|nr:DNA primase [Bacteroidales bacterium]MBR5064392.1 DNA primase [Bacteroidales bacterium]